MTAKRAIISGLLLVFVAGCTKIPINNIDARFDRADATWFADEQTLFFFYEVSAEQGLSPNSVIEVSYQTDDGDLVWTSTQALTLVHEHGYVNCGVKRRCGSLSLHVPIEPRAVSIRMRYHVDGPLALDTPTIYNVVGPGPVFTNRSFVVYGVFTEDNRRIQWRGRHRFPTLRNEQVTELGLFRQFTVEDQAYGSADFNLSANPYGYALPCPADYVQSGLTSVSTSARAVFNTADLPIDASTAANVCAKVTVHEPEQPLVTQALARKNPEVEPAFPLLRSPVREATPIKFFLKPCDRVISEEHEAMQRQRMLYDGPARCIDDWEDDNFVDELAAEFRAAFEQTRPAGRDMILLVGLHRDDVAIADKVEEALAVVLPPERDRSTPRVAGGFVFDSDIRTVRSDAVRNLILWCPATIVDEEQIAPDPSQGSCAIVPDNANLRLGPFSLSALPILPSRSRYLDFIDTYSDSQAGRIKELNFLVPEFTPTTDNTDLGGVVVTFFNQEIITAQPTDVFSFCADEQRSEIFVFRSERSRSPEFDCPPGGPRDGDFCLPEPQNFLPLENLPEWHAFFMEPLYELGLAWEFPWLLRATYEVVTAANASAFGLSVPFGFGADTTDSLGTELWRSMEFSLAKLLTQCKRFCDHPTFDSAGIYNVTDSFRQTYPMACYVPRFPVLTDGGFPSDP